MKKLFFLLCTLFALSFNTKAHEGLHTGQVASDFKLKNIDGKMVSMADYKNAKGFIVTFTCNHCPYAKAYEDRIIALNNKYAAKGYPVIAINPNDAVQYPEDDFSSMKLRAKEKNFTFPYLHDESQDVARAYGAIKTPHIFIVQKENQQFIVKYIGAIDDNWEDATAVKEKYVENALDALLKGQPVAVANTKAIGCGVKWKK